MLLAYLMLIVFHICMLLSASSAMSHRVEIGCAFLTLALQCCDLSELCLFIFVFFFQAEDGIRDTSVTGVQTCALPISSTPAAFGLSFLTAAARFRGPALLRGGRAFARETFARGLLGVRRAQVRVEVEEIGRASCRERGEVEGRSRAYKERWLT